MWEIGAYYCNNQGLIVMAYPITAGHRGPRMMMVWGERFCMNWWMKRLNWWVIKAKELLNPDQITWHLKWKQTWGHNSFEVEKEADSFRLTSSFTIRNLELIRVHLKPLIHVGKHMILEKALFTPVQRRIKNPSFGSQILRPFLFNSFFFPQAALSSAHNGSLWTTERAQISVRLLSRESGIVCTEMNSNEK